MSHLSKVAAILALSCLGLISATGTALAGDSGSAPAPVAAPAGSPSGTSSGGAGSVTVVHVFQMPDKNEMAQSFVDAISQPLNDKMSGYLGLLGDVAELFNHIPRMRSAADAANSWVGPDLPNTSENAGWIGTDVVPPGTYGQMWLIGLQMSVLLFGLSGLIRSLRAFWGAMTTSTEYRRRKLARDAWSIGAELGITAGLLVAANFSYDGIDLVNHWTNVVGYAIAGVGSQSSCASGVLQAWNQLQFGLGWIILAIPILLCAVVLIVAGLAKWVLLAFLALTVSLAIGAVGLGVQDAWREWRKLYVLLISSSLMTNVAFGVISLAAQQMWCRGDAMIGRALIIVVTAALIGGINAPLVRPALSGLSNVLGAAKIAGAGVLAAVGGGALALQLAANGVGGLNLGGSFPGGGPTGDRSPYGGNSPFGGSPGGRPSGDAGGAGGTDGPLGGFGNVSGWRPGGPGPAMAGGSTGNAKMAERARSAAHFLGGGGVGPTATSPAGRALGAAADHVMGAMADHQLARADHPRSVTDHLLAPLRNLAFQPRRQALLSSQMTDDAASATIAAGQATMAPASRGGDFRALVNSVPGAFGDTVGAQASMWRSLGTATRLFEGTSGNTWSDALDAMEGPEQTPGAATIRGSLPWRATTAAVGMAQYVSGQSTEPAMRMAAASARLVATDQASTTPLHNLVAHSIISRSGGVGSDQEVHGLSRSMGALTSFRATQLGAKTASPDLGVTETNSQALTYARAFQWAHDQAEGLYGQGLQLYGCDPGRIQSFVEQQVAAITQNRAFGEPDAASTPPPAALPSPLQAYKEELST